MSKEADISCVFFETPNFGNHFLQQEYTVLYYMKEREEKVMDYSNRGNFDSCYGLYHVIERGDTLYQLGRRYRVGVSDIIKANPYVDVYNLQIGETLCIPAVSPVELEVESVKKEHHFSENESVKDVLKRAGISMPEFVQWLNHKN